MERKVKSYTVLVCGGREYNNKKKLYNILDNTKKLLGKNLEIVQGGANGADRLAGDWAKERSVPYTEMPAKWSVYGKSAGIMRNMEMLQYLLNRREMGDTVFTIAFPGGTGTSHMIKACRKKSVDVLEIEE